MGFEETHCWFLVSMLFKTRFVIGILDIKIMCMDFIGGNWFNTHWVE